jgi:hypothetical protein
MRLSSWTSPRRDRREQEWFQEIKRMMTVHSMHGLFLTCTQEFIYIYTTNS